MYFQANKIESELFDSPEIKLQLAHAFSKDGANETFRPRGTVEIRSFRGPKFTTDQPDLTLEDLELLNVAHDFFDMRCCMYSKKYTC